VEGVEDGGVVGGEEVVKGLAAGAEREEGAEGEEG